MRTPGAYYNWYLLLPMLITTDHTTTGAYFYGCMLLMFTDMEICFIDRLANISTLANIDRSIVLRRDQLKRNLM